MFRFLKRNKSNDAQKQKTRNSKKGKVKRKVLIKNAITIHKRQSKLLDNLNEETKNELQEFAMKEVFNIKK
tara:strand:+ start:23 stop:235 length:213 start_codon:yes stop_codon:yes gene_type:complete